MMDHHSGSTATAKPRGNPAAAPVTRWLPLQCRRLRASEWCKCMGEASHAASEGDNQSCSPESPPVTSAPSAFAELHHSKSVGKHLSPPFSLFSSQIESQSIPLPPHPYVHFPSTSHSPLSPLPEHHGGRHFHQAGCLPLLIFQ
jgi:hypothetical protein